MEWCAVRTEEDVEALTARFGAFHDACLREVHVEGEWYVREDLGMTCREPPGTLVRMLFQRQWRDPSAVELLFGEVKGFHLLPPPEGNDAIFEATLKLTEDGDLFWGDTCSTRGDNRATWVLARSLWWRDASDWMGEKLRYGPPIHWEGDWPS